LTPVETEKPRVNTGSPADLQHSGVADMQVDPNLPHSIIEDMVMAVTEGTPVQCDGHEGRKAVVIFSAIYESARMGQVVKLGHPTP